MVAVKAGFRFWAAQCGQAMTANMASFSGSYRVRHCLRPRGRGLGPARKLRGLQRSQPLHLRRCDAGLMPRQAMTSGTRAALARPHRRSTADANRAIAALQPNPENAS